ncbi:MAG: twin-arginine translocase TatA/TatE family subunit [Candidatus Omnitrophica bacterium CG07_land_8_20_14_0_80_42_15]|uniref:Sec-independent protein translocase protein TatA n=1 Tax=Candidatus Aquitaenariimonas noxiae TaxID=1974741 RepID=A0A2J0KV84_9BACT|nr:MAG: twin-arginine translocase TatA/TatE family subunit [Candidatus Omnitrophica bacterium CG07_land_8_20_14_0_80_42_15]
MLGRIGIGELVIILLIALLIFGAARLPEIGRALGRAVKEFKKGASDIEGQLDDKKEKK